jgi:uncharacterized RDD family membrane protein YckC
VKEPATARTGTDTLESLREARPERCPSCDAPVGNRHFCPACETFIVDPYVGRLASTGRRLAAAVLDSVFRDGGIFGAAVWTNIVPPGVATAIVGILSTMYGIASLYLWTKGTTPAKRLLGMRAITSDGEPAGFFRMAFRETIGKMISLAVFGMGYLTIPFDRERQGWHDKMAGTWIIHDDDA